MLVLPRQGTTSSWQAPGSWQPNMSIQLASTLSTGLVPARTPNDEGAERAGSPAQNNEVSSSYDSDEDDSDGDDYEDSYDDSSEEDDDEPELGPLQRISNALRAKQQGMLAERRHPVLEWKAVAQWHADNAAGVAAAEQDRKRREESAVEKAARRERKVKRKAQRKFTKDKEVEFRTLLEEYSLAIVKSEKRTALLTQFSIENRSVEKQKLAAIEAANRMDQFCKATEKIVQAEKRDEEDKQATLDNLEQCIDASSEMGRRYGILPAINTPPAPLPEEQDENSTVLILRVNKAPLTNDADSRSPLARKASASRPPMSAAKRQFFTLNLKRCKHVEELRGERIGDQGAKELARSLLTGACPRVRSIHLGWNLVKYSGVAALADCFTRGACAQLQELDLRCNNIDSKAFATLLTALEKGALPDLLDIGLQGNLLGDEGARALAHAFFRGTLHALRRLDVRQNRIRNDGVLALWNVFTTPNFRRFCPKLELLDMRRNDSHGALTRSFCPCPPYLAF
ncbi:NLR, CARD domain-containing protein 3 [Phytophthora pseudosyringae]|uniref:NLR, CARD domain-containing protein 3 n=1 Tax=Phytophthora pseudosyringae TaxID=221518 RepID=A0A8T1W0P6_9STRA|nr:NLR, CARD domain-containing protein 3 [Phytophthora pseudosyringae]